MKSVKMQMIDDRQLAKPFASSRVAALLAGSLWMAGAEQTALGADRFAVDSTQSRVSISGNVMGASIEAQGSGSLTAQYSGTLLVDVTGGTIQFPGGSQVVALESGPWQPLSDGSAGSAPADYGGMASSFSTTGVAAVRDAEVDVASGSLAMVNGRFDTPDITLSIPESATTSMAYRVQGLIDASGAVPLSGESASGQSAQGTLMAVGSQLVLTLPINYQFFFSLMSPDDTTVILTGQLVATRSL
jgi:hypothetical protein